MKSVETSIHSLAWALAKLSCYAFTSTPPNCSNTLTRA